MPSHFDALSAVAGVDWDRVPFDPPSTAVGVDPEPVRSDVDGRTANAMTRPAMSSTPVTARRIAGRLVSQRRRESARRLLLKVSGSGAAEFFQTFLLAKPVDRSQQAVLDINHWLPGQRRTRESDIRLPDCGIVLRSRNELNRR